MASKKRVVALNIGSSNIIAVQGLVTDAPQGQRTAVVEKITSMPTPKGAVRANGIHLPDTLSESLADMWKRNEFQTKEVIVAVNSMRIQSGVRWVPYFPPDQIAEAAPGLAKQFQIVPNLKEDESFVFNYVIRERTISGGGKKNSHQMLLLVITVPKSDAQALSNVIEDAGLELVGMDVAAFGTLRGASLPGRGGDHRVVDMLVDIGQNLTTMVLHSNGSIRDIATVANSGGQSVTDAIGFELKEATSAMREFDPETLKRGLAESDASNPHDEVTIMVKEAVQRQATQVYRDLDQFVTRYLRAANDEDPQVVGDLPRSPGGEERGLSSITLCGGGSALYGLANRLSERDQDGFGILVGKASVSKAFIQKDNHPVPPFHSGVNVVSTVGLLTAERIG